MHLIKIMIRDSYKKAVDLFKIFFIKMFKLLNIKIDLFKEKYQFLII